MPELPEVETIKNDLKETILNKKIKTLEVRFEKLIKSDFSEFFNYVEGNKFKDINRIGKLMIFSFTKGSKILLLHLKMTGQLIYQDKIKTIAGGHQLPSVDNLPNSFTGLILHFSDNSTLYFNDMRHFASLRLVDGLELAQVMDAYGPEPQSKEFTVKYLTELFTKRKTNIKALLLNQKLIAGIGNIYADEILFQSGVLPWRVANTLTRDETKKIHQASRQIIKKAIKYRGTTFSDYRDSSGKKGNFSKLLKVYGRAGQKCTKCTNIIQKNKTAGRGTTYCPKCQS